MGRRGSLWNPPANVPLEWAWTRESSVYDYVKYRTSMPYDVTDELLLRAYGDVGTPSIPRPAALWQKTLLTDGTLAQGKTNREYFTAWSSSRDLRSLYLQSEIDSTSGGTVPYALTPITRSPGTWPSGVSGQYYVFPAFPARVSANPDVSVYNTNSPFMSNDMAADQLAIAATNIASAMERLAGYSHEEACSFAANYLAYRWSSWTLYSDTNAYGLVNGPSFIDDQGICLRAADATKTVNNITAGDAYAVDYGGASDLNAKDSDKVYVGFVAQPFINEVAVYSHYDSATDTTTRDVAIELYNPYNVALDLRDYKLRTKHPAQPVDATNPEDEALTGFIPPRGYYVYYSSNASGMDFSTKIISGATKGAAFGNYQIIATPGHLFCPTGDGHVVLLRKITQRQSKPTAPDYVGVDDYGYDNEVNDSESGRDKIYYERRDNDDAAPPVAPAQPDNTYLNYAARWMAAGHFTDAANKSREDSGTAPEQMTLGGANAKPDPMITPTYTVRGVPLYDRYAEVYIVNGNPTTGFAAINQRSLLFNAWEFEKIARITNEVSTDATHLGNPLLPGSGGGPSGDGPISDQFEKFFTAAANSNLTNSQCQDDAAVHFDFLTNPFAFNNTGGLTAPAALQAGQYAGDIRAMKLLDCLAFVDRVSDYSLDFGYNGNDPYGLSKLRIPGRININTASPNVLATLPPFNAGTNNSIIGDILAYRWRCRHDDQRIPAACQAGAHDFDDVTKYPGYGIRSMGELMVPLSVAFAGSNRTMYDRDAIWGQLYNMCTVRSDTFVVYAYLEAIKVNPKYAAGHNNSSDWYGAFTDNPDDNSAPNLRVGRKRWIALIDRSGNNFDRFNIVNGLPVSTNTNFSAPKIIAVKDLPQ